MIQNKLERQRINVTESVMESISETKIAMV